MLKLFKSLLETSQVDEGKMSEIDAGIREIFKDVDIIEIGKSSSYTYQNHNATRKFIVYPVIFTARMKNKPRGAVKKQQQQYIDYAFHPINSTEITQGLPKKLGGDIVSVD